MVWAVYDDHYAANWGAGMATRRTVLHNPDYALLIVVVSLCVFGLLMVYSAGMSVAGRIGEASTYFFVHQGQLFLVGLVAMFIGLRIDYHQWRRWAVPGFAIAIVLLIAVLLFGKVSDTGSRRWLVSTSFQPSELAKIAVIIFVAEWLPRKGDDVRSLGYGLVPFGVLVGFIVALIQLEPDLGTSSVILLSAATMFLVAGADILQFVVAGGLTGFIIYVAVKSNPYQLARLGSGGKFWEPCGSGNEHLAQICQGIIAMGSGGLTGLGLGSSRWRWDLPLPYSDSILAIIGEELGLFGTMIVVVLFALLVYRGLRIAFETPDSFGRLMAVGITAWLGLQATINIGGNVALLPFTGVPLPFISFGGSSLVTALFAVGILLNISRQTQAVGAPAGVSAPLQRIPHAPIDYGGRDGGTRLPGSIRRGSLEKGPASR